MKRKSKQLLKSMLAMVLVIVMIAASVVIAPSTISQAATVPVLNQKTLNLLVGKQFDLNVNHKIKNSSYVWTSSDKKIATVSQKGVVTGISKGDVTITCKMKTSKNTYQLVCNLMVVKGAKSLAINNKITALNLGQKYDLNRNLEPSISNDKTTWTSSNKSIANPDKNGKFTALKEGTVTITGTTLSGVKDSVTFTVVDKNGTVTTQEQLDTLLGSGASVITIKTTDAVNFVIPAKDYSKQKLVIDAPNSDITNSGTFSSIEIKQIKSDTWTEKATGNRIKIYDQDSRVIIAPMASAIIEIVTADSNFKLVNNGTVKNLILAQGSNVSITGTATTPIPVNVTAANIQIQTSVPLQLSCSQKIELTLLSGSENSRIQATSDAFIPTIYGSITIKVIVGTGSTSKEVSVSPTTLPSTQIPTTTPSTPTPTTPSTSVQFDDLDQSEIVEAMGAGWNLGNQLEAVLNGSPKETNWGNPVITEDLIKAVKKAGFKSVRIPVSYLDMIGDGPDYKINEAWLDRVQEVVDYCVDNDMFAIINVHGDGYYTIDGGWLLCGEDDQTEIKVKYEAVWKQIATRFKDYDEHLIFESMNEEFDNTYNDPVKEHYDNINAYNQIFLDTIRQAGGNNDMRWVLIPGWNTNIEYTAGDYGFVMPTDNYLSEKIADGEKRIMVSVHYYAPWDFCGGETDEITQWGESATDQNKVSTHSGQSYMASQFKMLYDKFTSKGYPVVIGEYGSIDKSLAASDNTYYRAYFARKVIENSKKYGCVPVIWDNGVNGKYGFGLFNRTTYEVTQPEIVKAIMNAYYGSSETGTATGITLDQSVVSMAIGDDPITLHATITPGDTTDTIKWDSNDETVATISDTGVIRAYSLGTTVITATVNGHTAQCTVNVQVSKKVSVGLYALETKSWSSIKSDTNAVISPDGGTYTLTLKGSRDMLSNIGSLYLKDIQVQSGTSDSTLFKNAKIQIDSVTFNGVDCTVTQAAPEESITSKGQLDFALLNQWNIPSQKISEVALGTSGSYFFTAAQYQDANTIVVKFTVSDIVAPDDSEIPTTPVATITPITSIKYDFTVSGVVTGSSLKFTATDSNWGSLSQEIAVTNDGDYSITFQTNDVLGLYNLGYFDTIDGSPITVTLNKVTINGTYVIYYNANLLIGSSSSNGLANIWNTSPGKIAEGTDSYLAYNSDQGLILFYTMK